MYQAVKIEGIQRIAFIKKQEAAQITLTLYSKADNQDLMEEEVQLTLPINQVEEVRRVYVLSVPCYRETGPWPDHVYCIQGHHSHPLDDGDSLLSWCYHFRTSIQKGINPHSSKGSASVATSKEIFDTLFGDFGFRRSSRNMGYSIFHFAPPKDNVTGRDKSFLSGFTLKETVTQNLVNAYITPEKIASIELQPGFRLTLTKKERSIKLGKGRKNPLKQKLRNMAKRSPDHPSLKHVHILKEPVDDKYPVFKLACSFDQIQRLESLVGKFCRKGYRSIRPKRDTDPQGSQENPKFIITYRPSKFKLSVKFTHMSD
jgi:hypothetical protein